MKLYRTTAVLITNPDEIGVTFQGSQTEASKARTAAKADGYKATTQEFDMPTSKGPMLAWLNANVNA